MCLNVLADMGGWSVHSNWDCHRYCQALARGKFADLITHWRAWAAMHRQLAYDANRDRAIAHEAQAQAYGDAAKDLERALGGGQ